MKLKKETRILTGAENLKDFNHVDTNIFREKSLRTNSYGSKFCDTIEECLIYLNENKLKYVDIIINPNINEVCYLKYILIFERVEND